ncbi:AraC family transcriptional regulator [Jannaschia sp. CCS1]|uniref:AraC family transcriptional regulator n=1 Tax=Jannaschia sp. (strain CCS1) TaxID=290400 RepID=UPI00140F9D06|nr:helix-turn-helix transcriptional regulator [Jannaschia sp. CCS1]
MGQNQKHPVLAPSSADTLQGLPYEVVSYRKTYESGYRSDWHSHPRHQIIYSVSGLMMTDTEGVRWAVPSGFGLIVPAGIAHTTKMIGDVSIETLYVSPSSRGRSAFESCRVVSISAMLASLISELCREELRDRNSRKAFHLRQLIFLELSDAPTSHLAVKYPVDPQLRRVCDALIADPANSWTIDQWAFEIGKSRRSFTRAFYSQTDQTFRQWTQRLRCQLALQKRAEGQSLERIARDLGYGSRYSLEAMMQKLIMVEEIN